MTTEHHLHRIYSKLTPLLPLTSDTLPTIQETLAEISTDMVELNWINPEDATNVEKMLSAYWNHFKLAINNEYDNDILE